MASSAAVADRLRDAVEQLPERLRAHVLRVEVEAIRLAQLHGVDPGRASLAALGHDLLRHKTDSELMTLAAHYGAPVDDVERRSPILIHGPVAARMLDVDFGLSDESILQGVDCHTTARAGMDALEKVLFLADKVEPAKLERQSELAAVARTPQVDLGAALLAFLDLQLDQSVTRGWQVHRRSLEARNELLAARD